MAEGAIVAEVMDGARVATSRVTSASQSLDAFLQS
jgi:hypothetical protein